MTSHYLVTQAEAARCNLRVPAGSNATAEIRAYRAADQVDAMRVDAIRAMRAVTGCMKGRTTGTTEASWLHTPKFGPTHHSHRWRRGT